jgi:hypothetical protein
MMYHLAAALPLPSVLSDPLYAGGAVVLFAFLGSLCYFKLEQPIPALICYLAGGYIGYIMFTHIG